MDPERDSKESINTYMQNRDKRFIGVRDSDINKIENFAGQFYVQFARDIFWKK
ncbi:MAG: SCO family protein [Leptospiraceae bacterium]|nr:SCO family protein [Leptospiraceae bacterium]